MTSKVEIKDKAKVREEVRSRCRRFEAAVEVKARSEVKSMSDLARMCLDLLPSKIAGF